MTDALPKPVVDDNAEHSEYAPSAAKRWMTCTGSISLIRQALEEKLITYGKPSDHAAEGTAAHELAAFCLENNIEAKSQLGKFYNGFEIDDTFVKYIQRYVDYINGLVELHSTLWVEVRVPLIHVEENMFGTADAVVIHNHPNADFVLEVNDLKYGKGVVVEALDNYQLRLYAIGILIHLAGIGKKFSDDAKVRLTIVQPRAPHDEGPVRSEVVTIAQLREFKNQAIQAVLESKSEFPRFAPSEDTCRWCPAGPVCRANAQFNLRMARLEFEDLLIPEPEMVEKFPQGNTMKDEELASIFERKKAFMNWLNSVQELIFERLRHGLPFPGYKLVYGRSNRAWRDEEEVVKKLVAAGFDIDELYNSKLKSPAQMEDHLDDENFELIKDQIVKPLGNLTITDENDARSAVDPNSEAMKDFKDDEAPIF